MYNNPYMQRHSSSDTGPFVFEDGTLKAEEFQHETIEEVDSDRLIMEKEAYNLKIIFEVAETQHNFERGNIYVQAQLNSYLAHE